MLASPLACIREPRIKVDFQPPEQLLRSVPTAVKKVSTPASGSGLTAAASPWVPGTARATVTAPLAPKPAPDALGNSPSLNPVHLQAPASPLALQSGSGSYTVESPLLAEPPVHPSKQIITAEAIDSGVYTYEMFMSLRKDCAHTPHRVLNWAVELYRSNPILKTPPHILLALDEPLIEDDGSARDGGYFLRAGARRRRVRQIHHKVMSVLSRVTPQKYPELQRELLELPLKQTTDEELKDVVRVFFEKAVAEQKFSPLYADLVADLCRTTDERMQDREQREKTLAHRLRKELLMTCQEEFTRPLQLSEDDKVDPTTGRPLEDEDIELKRDRLKRRLCGNIKFVGELYKKRLVTERVVDHIMNILVGDYDPTAPSRKEDYVFEVFQTLLRCVGGMCKETNPEMLRRFMGIAKQIETSHKVARVRFSMMDLFDLEKRGWVTKDRLMTIEEQEREQLEAQRRGFEELDRRARQHQQEFDEFVLAQAFATRPAGAILPQYPVSPTAPGSAPLQLSSPVTPHSARMAGLASAGVPMPPPKGTPAGAPIPPMMHHMHHMHHVHHHHMMMRHAAQHHHHLHHAQHNSSLQQQRTAPPPPPLQAPSMSSPTATGAPSLVAAAPPPPPQIEKHPHGTPTSSPAKGVPPKVTFQVTHLSAGLMTPPAKHRNPAAMVSIERSPVVHPSAGLHGGSAVPPSLSGERLSESLYAASGMRRVGSTSSLPSTPVMSPNAPPMPLHEMAINLMTEYNDTKQLEPVLVKIRALNMKHRFHLLTHWFRRVVTITKNFNEREQLCHVLAGIIACAQNPREAILSPHDLALCLLEWLRYDIENGQFENCPRLFANMGGMVQHLYVLLQAATTASTSSPSKPSKASSPVVVVPTPVKECRVALQGVLNGMMFTVLLRELHTHNMLNLIPTLVKDAHPVVLQIMSMLPSESQGPATDVLLALQNRFRILPFVLYGDGALTRAKTPPTPTLRGGSPLNDSLGVYDTFSQCLVLPKVAEDIEFALYRRMRESDSAAGWREQAVNMATASSTAFSVCAAGRLLQAMKVVGTLLTVAYPKDASQPLVNSISGSDLDEAVHSILTKRRNTIEYQAALVVELIMHFTYSVANITAPASGVDSPNKLRTPMKDQRALMGGSLTEASGSWSSVPLLDSRVTKMTSVFRSWASSGMIDGPAVLQLLRKIVEVSPAVHAERAEDIAQAARQPEDLVTLQFNFISETSWSSALQLLSG